MIREVNRYVILYVDSMDVAIDIVSKADIAGRFVIHIGDFL